MRTINHFRMKYVYFLNVLKCEKGINKGEMSLAPTSSPSPNVANFLPVAASRDQTTVSTTEQPPINLAANPVNGPVTSPILAANPNTPDVQQQNNAPSVPNDAPVLTESPKGQNVEIKPASQVTINDPTKTVEFFVSYGLTQTVLNDKTTSVYKTQTFAAIRPIAVASSADALFSISILFLLVLFIK